MLGIHVDELGTEADLYCTTQLVIEVMPANSTGSVTLFALTAVQSRMCCLQFCQLVKAV